MTIYEYDGSFEGLLCCVFEGYRTKVWPEEIRLNTQRQVDFISKIITIHTRVEEAERVWKGIQKQTSSEVASNILKAFLSEIKNIEIFIFNYIRVVFDLRTEIDKNYANPYILKIKQVVRQVNQEVHRMHAFVRFQKTTDNIFYASIFPDFNVIPLIGDFFKKRFADQRWLIYDTKRGVGIYYDLDNIQQIQFENGKVNLKTGDVNKESRDAKEDMYQILWTNYFKAVNIVERKNLKLQARSMPRKYWRYLTELKK
jgi:probable DNA metabolism protein